MHSRFLLQLRESRLARRRAKRRRKHRHQRYPLPDPREAREEELVVVVAAVVAVAVKKKTPSCNRFIIYKNGTKSIITDFCTAQLARKW